MLVEHMIKRLKSEILSLNIQILALPCTTQMNDLLQCCASAFFFYIQFYLFIFHYAGSLFLHARFSLVATSWGYSLLWFESFCGGFSCCRAWTLGHMGSVVVIPRLQSTGSTVVPHRFGCSTACGIFPDQGENWSLLNWQVNSLPLYYQRSTALAFYL